MAFALCLRTPGTEPASLWHFAQIRDRPRDIKEALRAVLVQTGDGLKQPLGIRMERMLKNTLHIPVLHLLARIHDHYLVRHLRNHTHVMGDEHDRLVFLFF